MDVSMLTRLSPGAIRALEDSSRVYNVHVGVAEIFAATFGENVDDIHWPKPLSHEGRPPLSTSKNQRSARRIITTTITTVEEYDIDEKLCEKCLTYQTPVLGECSICGA